MVNNLTDDTWKTEQPGKLNRLDDDPLNLARYDLLAEASGLWSAMSHHSGIIGMVSATALFLLCLSVTCCCMRCKSRLNGFRAGEVVSSATLSTAPQATRNPTLRYKLTKAFGSAASAVSLLKWTGLLMLVVQSSALFVVLRKSRLIDGPKYSGVMAVMLIEIGKLSVCLFVIAFGPNPYFTLYDELFIKWHDTLKLAIPAICYAIQNNLIFYASNRISAVVLQSVLQMKTLAAAIFSVLILGKRFALFDWLSFFALVIGVILVQTHSPESRKMQEDAAQQQDASLLDVNQTLNFANHTNQTLNFANHTTPAAGTAASAGAQLTGAAAALAGAALSGFSGVFLERMFTKRASSLFVRNVQLCIYSISAQLIALTHEVAMQPDRPLLTGFHTLTWVVVVLQGAGGLITAMVIKYAGNMPKTFAAAVSLLVTAFVSIFGFGLYEFTTPLFWLGVATVAGATLAFEGRKVYWTVDAQRCCMSAALDALVAHTQVIWESICMRKNPNQESTGNGVQELGEAEDVRMLQQAKEAKQYVKSALGETVSGDDDDFTVISASPAERSQPCQA